VAAVLEAFSVAGYLLRAGDLFLELLMKEGFVNRKINPGVCPG
jgi:hypothetical protein